MLEKNVEKKMLSLTDLEINLGHSSLSEQRKTLWLFERLNWDWDNQACPNFWQILKAFQAKIYVWGKL